MKNAILVLLTLFVTYSIAPIYSQSLSFGTFESAKESSDIVAFGEIISTSGFYVPNTNFIFTENVLRVDASLKGTSSSEVIFITRGGLVGDTHQEWSHQQSFSVGDKGYFFLEEVLSEGLLPSTTFLQVAPRNGFHASSTNARNRSARPALSRSAQKTLEFEFSSISYTGSEVTFDILAKASENLYLGKGDIYLTYPTNVFETNVVQNNKVEAVEALFLDSYGYNINLFDNTEEMMKVVAGNGCDTGSGGEQRSSKIPFTTSFQKMVTMSIDVDALSLSGLISMDEFNMSDAFFYLDSLDQCHFFDNIIVPDPIDLGLICSITSFTDSLRAGIGDTLTITGTGFGDTSAIVTFFDADDINSVATFNVDSNDIISWDSTEIKLLVPTTPGVAASGQFSVTTSSGMFCPSIDTLYIEYAIRSNRRTSGPTIGVAERLNLSAPAANNGKFILRPGPTLNTNATAKSSVEQAICDWNKASKLNLELGAVEPSPSRSADGQNNIFFTTAAVIGATNVPATTVITTNICNNTGGPGSIIYTSDIDLLILEDLSTLPVPATWNLNHLLNPSSTQFDFFGIVKHELGHLQMLRHAKFNPTIMHPASFPGNTNYRVIHNRDLQGATYSVSESIKKMDSSFACFKADTASLCITTSIHEFLEVGSEINIYPNPANSVVTVELSLTSFVQKLDMSIIDVTGRAIITKSLSGLTSGNNQILIDNLDFAPPGIYFLVLDIEGQRSFKRLVIQ